MRIPSHTPVIVVFGLCLLLVALGGPTRPAQAQNNAALSAAGVTPLPCPDFALTFRYDDGSQTDLSQADVTISGPGGAELPLTVLRKVTNPPIAVAIVVEASAAMNTPLLLGRTGFGNALELVTDLTRKLNAPDQKRLFSLVTFAETVEVPVEAESQPRFVTNAMSEIALELAAASPGTELDAALVAALELLREAPSDYNRALFVFAAGSPDAPLDTAAVQGALAAMRDNPPALTFVGLAPELEAAAAAVGAEHYPFTGGTLPQLAEQGRAIDARYSQVTTRSAYYQAEFRAAALPPGATQIELAVRGTRTPVAVEMCQVPPQVVLKEPQSLPDARLQFSVDVPYSQTPLISVTYALDSIPVGSAGPENDFRLEFAPFADSENRFTPGREYELSVVGLDTAGSSAKGSSTLIVLMPSRPFSRGLIGGGLVLLGAIIAVAAWLVLRNRGTVMRTRTTPTGDETRPPDGTQGPDNTLPPGADHVSASTFAPLKVHIHDLVAGESYSYELTDALRPSYDIGVSEANPLVIRRKGRGVSRNHAKLTPVSHGWELTDTSQYGTYRGSAPQEAHRLGKLPVEVQPGDTIWIGKEIKLTLERIGAPVDGTLPPDDLTEPPDEGTLPPDTPGIVYTQAFRPLRVVVHDARGGESYSYELRDAAQPSYDIGHSEESPVWIRRRADGVSRHHAKLTPVSHGWELTDTSQYGTFLGPVAQDEQRLGRLPIEVEPGMTIWIGKEIRLNLEWV